MPVAGFDIPSTCCTLRKLEWVWCTFLWYLYTTKGEIHFVTYNLPTCISFFIIFFTKQPKLSLFSISTPRYLTEWDQVLCMLFILIRGKFFVFIQLKRTTMIFELLILSLHLLNSSSAKLISLCSWVTKYLWFLIGEWNIVSFAKRVIFDWLCREMSFV